jgi:hypothetical protein
MSFSYQTEHTVRITDTNDAHTRDDTIQHSALLHSLVDKEGLRHRRRVGETGRLDDDGVELALLLQEATDALDQIAAHGAADATIVHLDNILLAQQFAIDQGVVDTDLAKLRKDTVENIQARWGLKQSLAP